VVGWVVWSGMGWMGVVPLGKNGASKPCLPPPVMASSRVSRLGQNDPGGKTPLSFFAGGRYRSGRLMPHSVLPANGWK